MFNPTPNGATERNRSAHVANRWTVGLPVAAIAGVATFLWCPSDWVLPAFGIGVAVAFIAAVTARASTKPHPPVEPMVEIALSVINLPPDPLAKVPKDWPLWSLAASTSFVAGLFVAIVWAAHA